MAMVFDAALCAALVRTLRATHGLRGQAAKIGDISPATLSRLERGRTPDLLTFVHICRELGIAPSMFLVPEPTTSPQVVGLIERELRTDGVFPPRVIDAFLVLLRAVRSPHGRDAHAPTSQEDLA